MQLPYENWLKEIAEHLHGRRLTCVLGYDDRRLGDLLALTATSSSGLCELDVHRTAKGAVLILSGQSRLALQVLADALGPFHQSIPRLKNAKRKFCHRIERMLEHLVKTFEVRAKDYPQDAFVKVCESYPEASPMVGIEALFREREHEPSSVVFNSGTQVRKEARKERRYPSRFAARVTTPMGPRAALFDKERGEFRLPGADKGKAGFVPIPPGPELPVKPADRKGDSSSQSACNPWGCYIIDVPTTCPDCGGIDLPDCQGIGLPDCGGCDIGF